MMEKLSVIGCGTMGHSIALQAAWAGMKVTMQGIDAADVERAMQQVQEKLQVMARHQLIHSAEITTIRERILTVTTLEAAIVEASFIIEAIPESIGLKQEIFALLDTRCSGDVILASNTSGLLPSQIAALMGLPERFIVAHFWNPAHLIPLVEIVPHPKTSSDTLQRTLQLMQAMNKTAIEVKKEVPGFVVNRLQYALFREAQYLLQEGIASMEDIDKAVTSSIGRRLPVTGPFATADMGGLDVFAAISGYLFQHLSKADQPYEVLQELVQQQQFGAKTGGGFYKWDSAFTGLMNGRREAELIRFLKEDLEAARQPEKGGEQHVLF